jgi:hypothetical protein
MNDRRGAALPAASHDEFSNLIQEGTKERTQSSSVLVGGQASGLLDERPRIEVTGRAAGD